MEVQHRIFVATAALFACTVLLAVTGCGSDGPALYDVSGTLTHNGAPLPDMMITFLPTDGSRASVGTTDADGKFTLFFTADAKGVQGGEHVVSIRSASPEPGALQGDPAKLVEKYGSEENSPCRMTIDSNEKNLEVNID